MTWWRRANGDFSDAMGSRMQTTRRQLPTLRTAGLVLLALVVGLAGGILLDRRALSAANSAVHVPAEARSEFALIAEAWQVIEREYVNQEGVQPRRMAHRAISGMVQTLGDAGHTRFLTPEMAQRHESQLQGEFEGIGAYVEMKDGRVVIVAPIDDSPAQRAGLEPGQAIIEVDGEDTRGLPLDEVVSRVLGPAGTKVTLTILDPDTGETREVRLERAKVEIDPVTWQRLPGTSVAYVRFSAFSDGATEDLKRALDEIGEVGVSAVILDLRNNPGGLLDEAIGVTSQFVERGNVLLREDAEGQITAEPVKRGVEALDMPMVALANGGTASAAEIVTGALQDYERATVVGTTTFGAGTVLDEFSLADGSALLLAVEEWLTPDERVIWQEGLAPDVEVTLPPDTEPLLRLRQQDFTGSELRHTNDAQLLRALELLQGSQSQ
jgi:carboxyl-terminal processing protease